MFGPVTDQEAGARGLDERRGRMTLQIVEAGVVEIGNVEVARGDRDAEKRDELDVAHGRPHSPAVTENQNWRLGG